MHFETNDVCDSLWKIRKSIKNVAATIVRFSAILNHCFYYLMLKRELVSSAEYTSNTTSKTLLFYSWKPMDRSDRHESRIASPQATKFVKTRLS